MKRSRTPAILGDCATLIFKTKAGEVTGNFFVDETLLKDNGVTCFKKYLNDPSMNEDELIEDYFLDRVSN